MVGDVDHCFRFFQNWHTPELLGKTIFNHRARGADFQAGVLMRTRKREWVVGYAPPGKISNLNLLKWL